MSGKGAVCECACVKQAVTGSGKGRRTLSCAATPEERMRWWVVLKAAIEAREIDFQWQAQAKSETKGGWGAMDRPRRWQREGRAWCLVVVVSGSRFAVPRSVGRRRVVSMG